MFRKLALDAEVIGGFDEPDAEDHLPETIGDHPRGEGIFWGDDPASESETIAWGIGGEGGEFGRGRGFDGGAWFIVEAFFEDEGGAGSFSFFHDHHLGVGAWRDDHGWGLGVATAAIDGGLIKEGEEAIVVALGEGIELVIVTAAAVESEAEPSGSGGFSHIHGIIDAIFFGDGAAFAVDGVIAEEGGGEFLFGGGVGEEIAGELPEGELVVGKIFVESFDHPIAPRPAGPISVVFVAIAIGVAGDFHPVPGHAFTERGGSEKAIDEGFDGGLAIRLGGLDEIGDLGWRKW